MDNFSSNPERRHVQDISAINRFLSKMYGVMALAVLVSAATAYLTMTTFRSAIMGMNTATMWIIFLAPIFLSMGISFKSMKNPGLGFAFLMIMAVIYGFEFAMILGFYTGAQVTTAFLSAAAVFVAMAAFGTMTKRSLSNWGAYLGAALIGFMVAWIVNMFLRSPAVTYIFSFIGVIIFTGLTAYDAQNMKNLYSNMGDQVSDNGLAVIGALNMYLDFINIFMFLLQIFGMSDNRN
ncbi:Bax inhibitor-1 family protein [Lactobacillus kalixensis]|uniref:Integral membrane protein n=1 Tax=Lactobacillus kalixensis DSM 16043 TaxID=1423763 RepID=A0A0R1UP53_9LACO|nr:Bax inhibitor-1/YccA family protein [Lactobacillus kalixensis]KRL91499.1 hypothetical protein FC46_GL000047 [Lactobacillus kalixensis DSM 16043]